MGWMLKKKVVSKVHWLASRICNVLRPAQSWENEELVPAPLFQL